MKSSDRRLDRDQVLADVRKAFKNVPRPDMFIRGTCLCEECREHEAEMQAFVPDDLPLEKLDNPGWDPICFASNAAFAYFMPGLVRLVLSHADDYVQQFVFHLDQPERLDALSPAQALALVRVLDYLVLHEAGAVDDNLVADELMGTREKLERHSASRSGGTSNSGRG